MALENAPDIAKTAMLYGAKVPNSGQADSRNGAPNKKKKENSSRDFQQRLSLILRYRIILSLRKNLRVKVQEY